MPYLLDTNILSELRKGPKCDPCMRRWAAGVIDERQFIRVLSLGEIRKGIEILRRKAPDQCPAFESWLGRLQAVHASEIPPVTDEVADRWGRLAAMRSVPVIDGLIAATALEFGLTLATRNASDFKDLEVAVVNPFEDQGDGEPGSL